MRCLFKTCQSFLLTLGLELLVFGHSADGLVQHAFATPKVTKLQRLPTHYNRLRRADDTSYSSTTTVIVTATRSSSSTSSDDDGGSNTSQTAWIIAGAGVGALALIGGIFYFATKDKDLNWMDLLTANKDNTAAGGGGSGRGSEMGQIGGPPPSQAMGPMSNFGGMPPQGDPFGGAGSAPMGPLPDANPFDASFSNQPVPQAGSFVPPFPPPPPMPQQQHPMQPPVPPRNTPPRSRSQSASSSSASSSSSRRGKRAYEKSVFSDDSYDPTVHHDRAHSPNKSQFFAPSAVSGGYAVTSVSRMYDVHGNRIYVKDALRGGAGSIAGSDTGYGMPRSRAGTPVSKSYISKSLKRLSDGSGATGMSFKSGRTGRSMGTGISTSSFGKKSSPGSYAPTPVSRNAPRNLDDASFYTGRSFSSSRLAPRSLGRTAPLSLKSGRSGRRRGSYAQSAFSDDTDASDARSKGSSALTSRTAGTRTGGSAFKSSAFSNSSSRMRGGLKLSESDYSRSGFTSSAGPKGAKSAPFGRSAGLSDIDEEGSTVFLDGPVSAAGRDYVRGGSSGLGQSSALAPNSRTGITLSASDLSGASYNVTSALPPSSVGWTRNRLGP